VKRWALRSIFARARLGLGVSPLSERWGFDRGTPLHRHYIRRFLEENASDVRGSCLEFNDSLYTEQIGGHRVIERHVIHVDRTNPRATIVADLTKPNEVGSDRFDCIICTHVLHVVFDLRAIARELHRILRPGGVLLVAVPQLSMAGPEFDELWRFTSLGLRRLLEEPFGRGQVEARGYGNALVAAAEIRGLVAEELTEREISAQDPRFAIEACARAVKR
jgi:SAM-dependent methyltransferase